MNGSCEMRSIISILSITSLIFGCQNRNSRDFLPTSGSINNPLLADESPGDAVQKPSPKSQVYVIGDAKQKYQQALNLVENLKEQLHKSTDKNAPKKQGLIDFVVVDNKEKALSLLNLEAEKRLKQEQESFEGGSLIAEAMIVDPKEVSKLALTSPNQDGNDKHRHCFWSLRLCS